MRLTAGMATDLQLAGALASAVAQRQFSAVFQPQIALATGAVVAVEGLCRWTHPRLGSVEPDRFIHVAEKIGAIDAIGQFMIDECLRAADQWARARMPIEISVNVSPLQLTASFTDDLSRRWAERGMPVDSLTLEITETLPVPDLEASIPRLRALRDVGIGISLDDFGTGHASREQLARLPVTEVKLDRSLLHDGAPLSATEVAEVVGYAHARGVRVVAEGIESESQLDCARGVGCDRAQGYLLGAPMGADDIQALLAA
jgi:EAL domain-containing protein (putative c-di-GMP-specific phosphodiesterase class I)